VNGLIVDASVAIKWFIDEPGSAAAVTLLRHPISAPDLLAPECANILWKKVTRGELQADEAEAIALALEGAVITLHSTRPHLANATRFACDLGRAAYDCFYLALAENLRQPLVTADLRLVRAVRAAGASRFAELVVPLRECGAV
jgi:predicted nucleic acid-binding protein